MPNYTPNLNLVQPLQTEFYDVEVQNGNMGIIDGAVNGKYTKPISGIPISDLATNVTNNFNRYGTATGTNTLTVNLNPPPTTLYAGLRFSFKNTTANTGAVTINVNTLGAKALVQGDGTALVAGKLKAGSMYTAVYDGSNFFLQGEGGGSLIKSMHRGNTEITSSSSTLNINFPSVNIDKSIIILTQTGSGTNAAQNLLQASIVDATTATVTRESVGVAIPFGWVVVEYVDDVTVRRGVYNAGSNSQVVVSVPGLNPNKSILNFTYKTTGANNFGQLRNALLSTDAIIFNRSALSGNDTISWYITQYP